MRLIVNFVFVFGGLCGKLLCNLACPDHFVDVNEMIGDRLTAGFATIFCFINGILVY